MSFEDEKDIINNSDDGSNSDVISWDSIIDTDQDGIVSIKNNSSSDILQTEVFTNDTELQDTDLINLDDAVNNSSNINPTDNGDDDVIDEDELKRILGNGGGEDIEYIDDSQDADIESVNSILNDEYSAASMASDTEPDFNSQETAEEIELTPRKDELKQKSSSSPVLIILILLALVAAAGYAAYTFMSGGEDGDVSQVNMPAQNDMQQNNQDENIEDIGADNPDAPIPVINEDEVSELKPEEKTEEKKEVVTVIPTGRTDPFTPISKYVYVAPPPKAADVVVKTINNLDYNSVKIPAPPKEYGELSEIAEKLMSISVSGIMYDTQKPSAIINYDGSDYFVQINDKLNNFKVVDIGPNYVKIALGKNIYKAEVGEQFKITEFFGNVPYQGGARQYYSSEEEFVKRVENAKKYTSNNDVKIYAR